MQFTTRQPRDSLLLHKSGAPHVKYTSLAPSVAQTVKIRFFKKELGKNCKNYSAAFQASRYVNNQRIKYVIIKFKRKKKDIQKLVFTWKQNFKNVKRLSP